MTNPALRRLGFAGDDRVAIIHADDVGMCQATLPAFADLMDAGLISSAATMVPCPWFAQVAAFCRGSDAVDMGVHLTTTCEYTGYRWGPLSTRDPASGLIEGDCCFYRTARHGRRVRPACGSAARARGADRASHGGWDRSHPHRFAHAHCLAP